jgi:phosphate transport system substrate-binding protein
MWKALRALVVGMLVLSVLVACGGGGETDTGQTDPGAAASPVAEASPEASPTPEASPEDGASPEAETEPGNTAATAPVELPEVVPSEHQGQTIVTAGSSTVFPLTQAIAERWQQEGGGSVTADSIGTGAGFERFCVAAETDIANASRPIEQEEIQQCTDNGREPIEFRVGTDALVVVVSAENDFVDNLTIDQLRQIYSGEAATWADVDPSWPAEPIQLFSPGTDSGTFDYFVEVVFEEDPEPLLAANPQLSEDDNVLVQGVTGSPYAIGYFGFAYYQENQEQLKALAVDGVEPNAETAESNEYPLSRPLFIYSAQSIMEEKPAVGAFINYYLQNVNDVIADVGYFEASTEALNEAKQNWLDATGQSAQ